MAPPTFYYFFDLPPELREQILTYLCVAPGGVHLGEWCKYPPAPGESSSSSSMSEKTDGTAAHDGDDANAGIAPWYLPGPPAARFPLNLFLVGTQFYREAADVYFGRNAFHVDATTSRRSLDGIFSSETGLLACPRYAQSRRRIRHVVLVVRRLGGQFQNEAAPWLLDMILCGALRVLDVRLAKPMFASQGPFTAPLVRPGVRGEGSAAVAAAAALAAGEGFRALLRLLADPSLERRSLAVAAGGHWTLWCPFHVAPPEGMREVAPPVRAGLVPVVRVLVGDGSDKGGHLGVLDEWLEVDVAALLAAHGGGSEELRILKIGD
ncbi:hypothetical protein NKR23_g2705 [Pleurostoma richardsiae]|uniref:Uncharacterized protein n=1 Tax=Pleurostoma richardsiae TaxID=41990 RepID=A0AA38S0W9_9PEZI|nr:hypothetical protein NKR23_g2705 [Pleurostoma richardsiae]